MKKLLSLLLLGIATIFLISCSKQNNLDGEYYWISKDRNDKILTIKGNEGILESEGTHNVKINQELKTFEVSGSTNQTIKYKFKAGVLTANLTGVERDYYKKGSKAYKKALKKAKEEQKTVENKKQDNYKKAKSMAQTKDATSN